MLTCVEDVVQDVNEVLYVSQIASSLGRGRAAGAHTLLLHTNTTTQTPTHPTRTRPHRARRAWLCVLAVCCSRDWHSP